MRPLIKSPRPLIKSPKLELSSQERPGTGQSPLLALHVIYYWQDNLLLPTFYSRGNKSSRNRASRLTQQSCKELWLKARLPEACSLTFKYLPILPPRLCSWQALAAPFSFTPISCYIIIHGAVSLALSGCWMHYRLWHMHWFPSVSIPRAVSESSVEHHYKGLTMSV